MSDRPSRWPWARGSPRSPRLGRPGRPPARQRLARVAAFPSARASCCPQAASDGRPAQSGGAPWCSCDVAGRSGLHLKRAQRNLHWDDPELEAPGGRPRHGSRQARGSSGGRAAMGRALAIGLCNRRNALELRERVTGAIREHTTGRADGLLGWVV